MHCGVMVTGYNQGDWARLMAGDYDRPPKVPDARNLDDTLYMGELVEPLGFDSIWATEHYGSAYSMQPNPLQYLAYWAGRTSRVDVGTAVSPLLCGQWTGRAAGVRFNLGNRTLRFCLFDAAQPIAVPSVLGGPHQSSRCGYGGHRRPVVESGPSCF